MPALRAEEGVTWCSGLNDSEMTEFKPIKSKVRFIAAAPDKKLYLPANSGNVGAKSITHSGVI